MVGLEVNPLPLTSHQRSIQLYGAHPVLPSPELEALKIQGISFSWESGFFWLLENEGPWNNLVLPRVIFGKTGEGNFPLCSSCWQWDLRDHQRSGSQLGVGVSTSSCAGGSCWEAPHLKIVSQLKNGLNWPVMLKFTAGSAGAVCGNLGVVSLRRSAILLCFP